MKRSLLLCFFFLGAFAYAQPKLELTPTGFPAIEFAIPPANDIDRLETVAAWASRYNKKGYDILGGTDASVTVEARRDNAFFYRDRGVEYAFRIRYAMTVTFTDNMCRVSFSVKEIYGKDKLLETTVADYFRSDGRLKEDFADVKPSLEKTANEIVRSLYERLQMP